MTLLHLGSKKVIAPLSLNLKKDVKDNFVRTAFPTTVEPPEVFHHCTCCLTVECPRVFNPWTKVRIQVHCLLDPMKVLRPGLGWGDFGSYWCMHSTLCMDCLLSVSWLKAAASCTTKGNALLSTDKRPLARKMPNSPASVAICSSIALTEVMFGMTIMKDANASWP